MNFEEEINFNKFHQVIQEYERLIQDLTKEVDLYKADYEANKVTISSLVRENEELSFRLKNALTVTEQDETEHIYQENDLIENLKKQLSVLAKEKESVVQLWQTALKTVDYLEDELKLYEGRTHGYVPRSELKKLKDSYEEQINTLQTKIHECNVKLQDSRKAFDEKLETQERKLAKERENVAHGQNLILQLQSELKQSKGDYVNSETARTSMQTVLAEKNKQIDGFIAREEVAKNKVREAIQVVEMALMEKDAALAREMLAKDELARLTKAFSDAEAECEKKARTEIAEIKRLNGIHMKQMQQELNRAKEEIQMKNFEAEKSVLKLESLQREIEILQKGTAQSTDSSLNKLLVLEKNLESTFQKLLLSERNNLQLAAERDSIRLDMEQMASQFERDIQSREIEKRSLGMKITKLQEELNANKNHFSVVGSKLEKLKMKYEAVKKRYKSKSGDRRKTLSNISMKNSKMYKEMKKCYDKQVYINRKWKSEANSIYEALAKRIKELNKECRKVKTENYELKDKLLEAEEILSKYQQALEMLYTDVDKIAL